MMALSRAFGRDALVWRQTVGLVETLGGGVIRVGTPGQADIGAIIKGRAVQIEVKRPGEKATAEQVKWGEATRRAGGVWFVAHSVDEAFDHLRNDAIAPLERPPRSD